ncbi:hypothetical protein FA13DRAFT_1776526 [Coprinellus micaceus]|uniref:Uncharacterized protein n=1 Tax=Coprinellus micaceus TaxID=71717 RepID=A0A4Y7SZH9_COPMI|nr:hypothetical protein FA13DRAFT_1776526 [Coprinellus micaceus]
MFHTPARQASASNPGVPPLDCCIRYKKDLGSRLIFTFTFHISDGNVGAWNTAVVSYYNTGGAVKLPDNDTDGTISILTGKIVLMDPECIDFTIPNDTSGIYANLSNFDAYIEAERVHPLTPGSSPPTAFPATQPPLIILGGMASNSNRDTKPFSFTLDTELYMNNWKKNSAGIAVKPVLSVKAIYSSSGPYKKSSNPPVPFNKKCVMITGVLVGIEYDRTRTRASGNPIVARYIIDILHISFMGNQAGDSKTSSAITTFPNTLDNQARSTSGSHFPVHEAAPSAPPSGIFPFGSTTVVSTPSPMTNGTPLAGAAVFPPPVVAFPTSPSGSSAASTTVTRAPTSYNMTGTTPVQYPPPAQGNPAPNQGHPGFPSPHGAPFATPPPVAQPAFTHPAGYYAQPQPQSVTQDHFQGQPSTPAPHGYMPPFGYFQPPFGTPGNVDTYSGYYQQPVPPIQTPTTTAQYHHSVPLPIAPSAIPAKPPASTPPQHHYHQAAPSAGQLVADDSGLEYVDQDPIPSGTLAATQSTASTSTPLGPPTPSVSYSPQNSVPPGTPSMTSTTSSTASSTNHSPWTPVQPTPSLLGPYRLGKHPATDPPTPSPLSEPATKRPKPNPKPVTRKATAAAATASSSASANQSADA